MESHCGCGRVQILLRLMRLFAANLICEHRRPNRRLRRECARSVTEAGTRRVVVNPERMAVVFGAGTGGLHSAEN